MEIKKVAWRRGYRAKITAETAFSEIEKIKDKNGGIVTAELVVLEASKARSKLRKAFEWDDRVAGEQWRLNQARKMIHSIEVVYTESPHIEARAYEVITQPPKKDRPSRKVYMTTAEAMKDPIKRDEILMRAINEALALRKKYAELSELSLIFSAIDETAMTMKL